MTLFLFRLPDIGEGIAEAEIIAWHVSVGDLIMEDSPLADMMTDKATVEMESPVTGVIVELAGEVGERVAIGSTLAVIRVDDDLERDVEAEGANSRERPETDNVTANNIGRQTEKPADIDPQSEPRQMLAGEEGQASLPSIERKVLTSPAVRARALDLGIDLAQVPAEGERVRHSDLDAFLRYNGARGYRTSGDGTVREDRPIKVIGLRRKIAENMAAAKRAIPHFSYVEEVDVTSLELMRADLNATGGDRPKLTMLPLLITAICKTVPHFPMINARYDDVAGIVTQHGAIHLGMATQTEAGLMVPVIRDAQALNIWQLASEIKKLSDAVRNGKAGPAELSGGTLTITSLGPLGGIATTPVINRPEVAIIGPNKIVERPIFVTNNQGVEEIRKAKLMNISMSCDHRVVDGWDAASFVQALKHMLERPALLFAP